MVIIGSSLMGIGIGIAVYSTLGADALAVLCNGFAVTFSISLGTANMIIALLLLIPLLIFDRSQIGIGTILSPLLVGIFADLVLSNLMFKFPFMINVLFMLIGLLGLAVGIAIYVSANLGKSTYDACIFFAQKRSGMAIGSLRSIIDFLVLVSGILMGGSASLGPIVAIFMIGPLMQIALQRISNLQQVKVLFEN